MDPDRDSSRFPLYGELTSKQAIDVFTEIGLGDSSFKGLPEEVILHIFAQLGAKDYQTITKICRSFKRLSTDMAKLATVARQLHIPIKKDDKIETVKTLIALDAKFKKLIEKCIVPGEKENDFLVKEDQVKIIKNSLLSMITDQEITHPYVESLKKEIQKIEFHKTPIEYLVKMALKNILDLEKFSLGSFAIFSAGSNLNLVFKAPNSKVYTFLAPSIHDIINIYSHLLLKQIYISGGSIKSTPLNTAETRWGVLNKKDIKILQKEMLNQFKKSYQNNGETKFIFPISEGNETVYILEINIKSQTVIVTKEDHKEYKPGPKLPLGLDSHNEPVYGMILKDKNAKGFIPPRGLNV